MLKKSSLALFFTFVTFASHAASFDCNKAASASEKLICGDLRASELDELMGRAYKRALSKALSPNDVKQSQKNWLKQRDKCTDVSCIKSEYEQQLNKLREIPYVSQKWKMLKGERSELCQAVFNLVKNDPKMSVKLSGSPSYLSSISGVSFIEWKEISVEKFASIMHFDLTGEPEKTFRKNLKVKDPFIKYYLAEVNFDSFGDSEYLVKVESDFLGGELWGGSFDVFTKKLLRPVGVSKNDYYGRPFLFKNSVYILGAGDISVGIDRVFNEDGDTIRSQTYCNMEIEEK